MFANLGFRILLSVFTLQVLFASLHLPSAHASPAMPFARSQIFFELSQIEPESVQLSVQASVGAGLQVGSCGIVGATGAVAIVAAIEGADGADAIAWRC